MLKKIISIFFLCFIPYGLAFADKTSRLCTDTTFGCMNYEINMSYGTGELFNVGHSKGLQAVRLAMAWYPDALYYYDLSLGFAPSYTSVFDGDSSSGQHDHLVAFSLNPILRYYMFRDSRLSGFLEASVGVAHLSVTSLGSRQLGSHFAFSLFAGGGMRIQRQNYAILTGLRFMHWSNGNTASKNAGINVPIVFYLACQI